MAIITIARELGALGEELAKELVGLTGARLRDRDDIEAGLARHGLGPAKIVKFDEKKPGLWASLSQERDDYLHYLKLVMLEAASEGPSVIVGRGAVAILKGLPNLASIKVTSPLGLRAKRIAAQFGCDERRALQLIERSDHEKTGFHKYFFSVDWQDPRQFGLVVNTGILDAKEAAKVVASYISLVSTPEAEARGTTRLAELLLGQRVVTEVVYGRRIAVHFLEAEARGSRIVLHGVANTQLAIDEAVQAARTVEGVSEVESTIQVVQEFSVMP